MHWCLTRCSEQMELIREQRDLARTSGLYWPALFVQLFISILVNSKKNYLPKKSILIVIVGYLSGINCRQRHAELT